MIQEISRAELKMRMESKNPPMLVDVLSEDNFKEFHIAGAKNVPLNTDFEATFTKMIPDKDQDIVLYCASEECDAAPKAARLLENAGYTHVFDYRGGKKDWREAGHPVSSGVH